MAIVMITGCSRGFGLLTALEFARSGDHVFATVRPPVSADGFAHASAAEHLNVDILPMDVTDPDAVTAGVQHVIGRAGTIDVLINNAGIAFWGAFDTNFFGPLRLTQAVLSHIRAHHGGRIIMVSSANGIIGLPFSGVYPATKAALEALSEALAVEVSPSGIRVEHRPTRRLPHRNRPQAGQHQTIPALPEIAETVDEMRAANASPTPQDVASAIVAAAHAEPPPLRLQVGEDAHRLYQARRILDDETLAANGLAQWFEENATEDVVFYATPVGDEVRGRQAVADTLERFFSQANAGIGSTAMVRQLCPFLIVRSGAGTASLCQVFRFDADDRVSGEWGVAASDQETRRLTSRLDTEIQARVASASQRIFQRRGCRPPRSTSAAQGHWSEGRPVSSRVAPSPAGRRARADPGRTPRSPLRNPKHQPHASVLAALSAHALQVRTVGHRAPPAQPRPRRPTPASHPRA